MKTITVLALGIFLSACTIRPYVGLSYHDKKNDAPEIQLNSLLGTVGVQFCKTANFECYAEHTSGVTQTEKGNGLNQLGFRLYAPQK